MFTDKECDFQFSTASSSSQYTHRATKKVTVRVWIRDCNNEDEKKFYFLCDDRAWSNDEPSKLLIKKDLTYYKHPLDTQYYQMSKGLGDTFIKAFQEEYIALQILLGTYEE